MELILSEELKKEDDFAIGEKTRLVQENVPKSNCFKSFKGIFLAAIAALFSSIIYALVKSITEISSSQKTQLIFLQKTVYSIIMILITRDFYPFVIPNSTESSNAHIDQSTKNTLIKELLFLILSGLCNSTAQFLYYLALQNLPVGEVTVFRSTATIFVFILGKIFLDELIDCFNGLMLVISIIGIVLVSKVEFIFGQKNISPLLINERYSSKSEQTRLYAILFMISGTFLSSISTIIKRKFRNVLGPFYVFVDASTGSILFTIIITVLWQFKYDLSRSEWFLMILLGLLYFLEVISYNQSLRHENANLCSLIRTTSAVLFGFIFQVTFFDVIPDGWIITGAMIVTTSVSLVSLRKFYESKE